MAENSSIKRLWVCIYFLWRCSSINLRCAVSGSPPLQALRCVSKRHLSAALCRCHEAVVALHFMVHNFKCVVICNVQCHCGGKFPLQQRGWWVRWQYTTNGTVAEVDISSYVYIATVHSRLLVRVLQYDCDVINGRLVPSGLRSCALPYYCL